MKGFDPALIKFGVFALIFIGRAVIAANRKQKRKDRALRPPQSAPAPPPMASPSMTKGPSSPRKSTPDSPWSNSKGPFD